MSGDIPEDVIAAARTVVNDYYLDMQDRSMLDFVARAILAEREGAARIAEEHLARVPGHHPDLPMSDLVAQGYGNAAGNIAAAIRRGQG